MDDIRKLATEQVNDRSWNIDQCSTKEMLTMINEEDKTIAYAVEKCKDEIAKLVDHAVEGIRQGGRVIYVGAGTSGRLGILDASECPPTYGVSEDVVQGVIAGGLGAIIKAKEGAEDDVELGKADMQVLKLQKQDSVIGLAASGRTPYVIGALQYAKAAGCYTGAISCVQHARISEEADAKIEAITGPEAVCGSTRMKAGTAQKMILNMISTTIMIKLGKVYHNYMVDLQATNEKLYQRAAQMISSCTGCTQEEAQRLFKESEHHVKLAILMAETAKDKASCIRMLEETSGYLRTAVKRLQQEAD